MSGDYVIGVGTVGSGLWISYNAGQKWRHIQRGPEPESNVRALAVSPHDPAVLWASLDKVGLFRSEDGGWTWKFDEDLPSAMKDGERQPEDYQNLKVPLGLIYGAESELFSQRTLDYMRELVPQDFPAISVADAQHHVFLDQPLAFIDALREICDQLRG